MEHPDKIIKEVQVRLSGAIGHSGSIKAFVDHMNDPRRYFPMQHEWKHISYPTVRKLYIWTSIDCKESFSIDTLYRLYLMAEDYWEDEP